MFGSIPSPSSNTIHIGASPAAGLRTLHRLGVLAASGSPSGDGLPAAGTPATSPPWRCGQCRRARRGPALPRDHRLPTLPGAWLDAAKCGKAGSGSPAAFSLECSPVPDRAASGLPVGQLLDVVAPAIPVAQAIGRLGNWFNQELYGRPTALPWGLRISPEHRLAGYEHVRRTTRRSFTKRSGTWRLPGSSSSTSVGIPGVAPGCCSSSM